MMHELNLLALESEVEALSDALMEQDALSVSVEDADADTQHEEALWGEPGMPLPRQAWQRSSLRALFETQELALQAVTWILAQDWAHEVQFHGIHGVDEQDWVRLTQSQFQPVPITDDFWIVPTWHEVPPAARRHLKLDPGLAFGTGTHPTTRMCLKWIATHEAAIAGQAVLDYGCGSGILALAAALHGATEVDAIDIDVAAVRATLDNVQANLGPADRLRVRAGLPDGLPMRPQGYPVVLANILATPLRVLAPLLSAQVQAGGHLVLAGILSRQTELLQDSYAQVGLQLTVHDEQEGWVLMTAQRAAASDAPTPGDAQA